MTGITNTLKSKLIFFTGSIILLCLLMFILQYNNYFYTGRYIQIHSIAGKITLYPNKTDAEYQQFLKSEIFDENFYSTGNSVCIDSINNILSNYIHLLDTIKNNPYFNPGASFQLKTNALINDCQLLKNDLNKFREALLERGLFNTGKAGEWSRFGIYLEELAETFENTAIIKSIAQINRQKTSYQFLKKPEQIKILMDQIFTLKVQLSSKNKIFTSNIRDDERLKLINELDNFSALTIEIQKTDLKTGLTGKSGQLGEINLTLQTLITKAENLNQLIDETIEDAITRNFIIKSLLLLVIVLLYYWFTKTFLSEITNTIAEIKRFASELVQGKLPTNLQLHQYKETGEISDLYNNFVESLREKIKFASNLGSGKTDLTFTPLSADDTLSNALLDMEKSLRKAEDEDKKYKVEEQKRAWANEGHAKFSEILRMQTDNLSTLSDEIIIQVVKYLNANQGSIFLYNDEIPIDIHLELISSFAYDRKKYIKKRVEIGEGLVGTCAQEKQSIFLTDIPDDYIKISSGLGDAPPRSILIVPLKTEKNIFGVLEIASFQAFEKHEIEFVEKLAQSIASTFATVKINIHTARLLEQSKQQAEDMAQQEEEMRQNFEELQATQEESERKEAEITSLIQAVDSSALVLQTDMEGRIIELNKKFSAAIDLHRDELLGKYLKNIFVYKTETEEFYNLIRELKLGQNITRTEEIKKDGNESLFFDVHYSPISDRDGHPYKVLCIAGNLTQSKNQENTIRQKENEYFVLNSNYNQYSKIVDQGFIRCTIAPDTTIIEVNDNYIEITGYSREELIGSSYRKFLKAEELKQFELVWLEALKEKIYKGVIKRTTPTGEEHWLMANLIPFKDENNSISKFIFLAQDITEKKLKYQVLEEANKEIERLKGLQNLS
jgi:PAS domain S-box-containing protein